MVIGGVAGRQPKDSHFGCHCHQRQSSPSSAASSSSTTSLLFGTRKSHKWTRNCLHMNTLSKYLQTHSAFSIRTAGVAFLNFPPLFHRFSALTSRLPTASWATLSHHHLHAEAKRRLELHWQVKEGLNLLTLPRWHFFSHSEAAAETPHLENGKPDWDWGGKSCLAWQRLCFNYGAPRTFESINKLQIVYGMQINQISFSIKPASQEEFAKGEMKRKWGKNLKQRGGRPKENQRKILGKTREKYSICRPALSPLKK